MRKSIKYIALWMVIAISGITVEAKQTPGISPASTPVQEANAAQAWENVEQGAALRDLESRYLDDTPRNPVQPDGIIDFREERQARMGHAPSGGAVIARLPKKRIPGGSNLCGFIAYNLLDLNSGVYRMPITATQQLTQLRDASSMLSSFRGGAASENYYVMSYYGTTIQNGVNLCLTAIFDRNDWSLIAETGDYGQFERTASDMTYDPVTKRFYGCFLNREQSQYVLGYMQLDEASPVSTISSVTALCPLEVSLNGIAADNEGTLWGIRNDNGELVKINRKTGAMTTVASTGFVPGYNGSLAWDTTNHILYWAVTFDDPSAPEGLSSAILSVDPSTGALAHIYDFAAAAQTGGLYTEFTAASEAPGAVENLTADFAGESLGGSLTFDAPSALSGGSAATGDFTYTVKIVKDNGYVAYNKEHTCLYGAKGVSLPLTLKTAGNYTFTVQGFNDAGPGYPESLTRYVGPDMPEMPGNVAVSYADGTVSVSWDAVENTVHGGFHDPSDVKYTVTLREADAEGNYRDLTSQSVKGTVATWDVGADDNLRGYKATVTAVFGNNDSDVCSTPYNWFGALNAPFTQSMTADIDGWISLNAGTGGKWEKVDMNFEGNGWAVPYNWGTKNDAWLFSPNIRLEEGRFYTFTFKTHSTVVAQSLHVWMGREASVEAMDTKILDMTVSGKNAATTTFGFACTQTGEYRLGFHNDTRSDTWTNKPYMWLNDVTCEKAPDTAPAAPELDVDYDKTGNVSAHISLTAPSQTYAGAAVERLDRLTLKCNNKVVQEWENVDAGAEFTLDYTDEKAGMHTFIAESSFEGVSGVPAIVTVYLGMSKPVDPEWVEVKESETVPGVVEVDWSPVAKADNGQDIAPQAVKYNVMNIISNTYVEKNVEGAPYSFAACEPESQTAVYVSVNAETSAGQSSTYGTYSSQGIMHVGTPYALPFRETFADGLAHYTWTIVNQHSNYDRCSVIDTQAELKDADANGDGHALLAFVPYENSSASLYSGAIAIPADAHNPVIGFAVYRVNYGDGADNNNALTVGIIGSKNSGSLRPVRYGEQNYGWQYYYYDMSLFKGQTVKLLLTFSTNSYTSHYIDDIHFFDAPEKDVALSTFTTPESTEPGRKTRMEVTVSNLGTTAIKRGDATVELRRLNDGVSVTTETVPALAPFQSVRIDLADRLNCSFDPEVRYEATVILEGDRNPDNNTAEGVLMLEMPKMPAPQALEGTRNDEGFASLTWEAPDLTAEYPTLEIDFDSSTEPSMTDLGGFTSIDVDGNPVYEELGLSGHCGFISFPHTRLAHSGDWMVVSPCNADGAPKEDWLISPELSGKAQTISFYARTNWNAYETYSVLGSTTGCEREDFTATLLETTTDSNDWKLMEVEVPEGTLYFAIVCKAENTSDLIYLMLDDFRFEGADVNRGLAVESYKAYRDNVAAANTGATPGWEDLEGDAGPHFYRVTADYGERGESAPSNEVFIFTRGSGVEGTPAITGKVYTEPGRIIAEGIEGCELTVSAPNGMTLRRIASASSRESIEVGAGVYLVTVDGATVKLIVR